MIRRLRHIEDREIWDGGDCVPGLGVPCREAQADGVPCAEVDADCRDCDRAVPSGVGWLVREVPGLGPVS